MAHRRISAFLLCWETLAPTTVRLPYKETFGKGKIQISIEVIPNRLDAVKVHAYQHGCRDSEAKNWVQEGTGKVELVVDDGKEKCVITFIEMTPGNDCVKEVRLSTMNKWKEGPR
jgi:hypothetical protein